MKSLTLSLGVIALSGILINCGKAKDVSHLREAWDANNDPRRLAGSYEVAFAALPMTGNLDSIPWTDFYWPNYKAGIANRWAGSNLVDSFQYTPPSQEQVRQMSQEQLRQL